LICDNYGTHKHPAVKQWLAAHPRFHPHFTPTSASSLNLVERWFALITSQAIRRGSFDSVTRLAVVFKAVAFQAAGHFVALRRLQYPQWRGVG
jgi:hypothetical protein